MIDDNGLIYIKIGHIMQEVVLPTKSDGVINMGVYQQNYMIHVSGYVFGQFIKNFIVSVLYNDDKKNKKMIINTLLGCRIDINM